MRTPSLFDVSPRFDGPCFNPALGQARLSKQIGRVFGLIADGKWRTLEEMVAATGDPAASISAQLRHLRKPRFGGYATEKRRPGIPAHGLYEYRLVVDRSDSETRG